MEKPIGTFDKRCWLDCVLNSPDGNSGRSLIILEKSRDHWPRPIYGKIFHRWYKGHEPMLEAYLAERGVYPEW